MSQLTSSLTKVSVSKKWREREREEVIAVRTDLGQMLKVDGI